MLAFFGGSRVRLHHQALRRAFWGNSGPVSRQDSKGPDFPAGEGRKGLPLGQAERMAVRTTQKNRAEARTHFRKVCRTTENEQKL